MNPNPYEGWRQRFLRQLRDYAREHWRLVLLGNFAAFVVVFVPIWLWRNQPELRLGLVVAAGVLLALTLWVRQR